MENQHRKITGYRELDETEIGMINEIKALSEEVGCLIERMERTTLILDGVHTDKKIFDPRWVAIAKTDLQKGFMSLTRSVAKPGTF